MLDEMPRSEMRKKEVGKKKEQSTEAFTFALTAHNFILRRPFVAVALDIALAMPNLSERGSLL